MLQQGFQWGTSRRGPGEWARSVVRCTEQREEQTPQNGIWGSFCKPSPKPLLLLSYSVLDSQWERGFNKSLKGQTQSEICNVVGSWHVPQYVFNSPQSRIQTSKRTWNDPKQHNLIVRESWFQKECEHVYVSALRSKGVADAKTCLVVHRG